MNRAFSSRWGFSCLSTLLTLFTVTLCLLLAAIWQLPPVKTLADTPLQAPLRIFTQQGDLIAEIGEKQRLPVELSEIPEPLIQAILCTEDQRFYQHIGVDFIGLARAIRLLIVTGEKRQGASTITMQVARNFFLSKHKTFLRKFQEILLALKLEQRLTKQQILTLYLNKIFFGMRAYGVKAAARNYYGKSLHQLTLAEMAMLAGLPQAPSRNNPIVNPTHAVKRRNHVLKRMFEHQVITQHEYDAALRAPVTAQRHGPKIIVQAPYAAEMIRKSLVERFGEYITYHAGLSVYSTLDTHKQQAANQALVKGLMSYDHRHGFRPPTINLKQLLNTEQLTRWQAALKTIPTLGSLQPGVVLDISNQSAQILLENGTMVEITPQSARWALDHPSQDTPNQSRILTARLSTGDVVHLQPQSDQTWALSQMPKAQGALVSLDPHTGAIQSLVGGISYELSHFNRATQAWRQPGSAFKPFIYAAALDHGLTAATLINDAPVVLEDSGENELWRPHNDTYHFDGPIRLREGLVHSKNLVSIRILREIGLDYTRQYLGQFGFDMKRQPHTLSLALGTGSVTPLMLAQAYGLLAAQGTHHPTALIQQIIHPHQGPLKAIQEHAINFNTPSQHPHTSTQLSASTAFLVSDILKDVIQRGTGRQARILNRNDLAGKTGTTNDKIDAWFAGFTPDLVSVVWIGFDDNQPLKEFASQAALPVWIDYMRQALHHHPIHWFIAPNDIVQIKINPKTGQAARGGSGHFEYFKQGHEPNSAELDSSIQDSTPAESAIDTLY
ncbi:MAG: peptidase [Legionellales bacterium]|nr:peptidase [Legionellales bacterium]